MGLAVFTLKEEMGYFIILDPKEGWPVPIHFIFKDNTYDPSKELLFSSQPCFRKSQDKLVSPDFDSVWVVINIDSPQVGLVQNRADYVGKFMDDVHSDQKS